MTGIDFRIGWLWFCLFLGLGYTSKSQDTGKLRLLRSELPTDRVWIAVHRADCLYAPEIIETTYPNDMIRFLKHGKKH